MPELPEVETIARSLAAQVCNHRIVAIEKLDWERMIETPAPDVFCAALVGRRIVDVGRRGKWLLLRLDDTATLALHLRMSGRVGVYGAEFVPDHHTHFVLALDDGMSLAFRDPRKFGRARLLNTTELAALDTQLGPEPLAETFRAEDLAHILARQHTRIKPLLLDQRTIAGMGNIYVDETLWYAQIHPLRPASSLSKEETERLYTAMRTVLQQSIANEGSTLRDYRNGYGQSGRNQYHFAAYGRERKPCLRCGTPIERLVVAQRGTRVCPSCQPAPKRSSDMECS